LRNFFKLRAWEGMPHDGQCWMTICNGARSSFDECCCCSSLDDGTNDFRLNKCLIVAE
jgi:hypothetical protein